MRTPQHDGRDGQELTVERLLWAKEVAEILGCGRNRAYELMASGEIPAIRIGRSVRVRRQALDKWLAEQEANARSGMS